MTDLAPSLLTRKDAAALLGIPEGLLVDTARRKRGGPPFYKFTQRTVLYDRDELLHWHASVRVLPIGKLSAT
jgi:hypothetical protein